MINKGLFDKTLVLLSLKDKRWIKSINGPSLFSHFQWDF